MSESGKSVKQDRGPSVPVGAERIARMNNQELARYVNEMESRLAVCASAAVGLLIISGAMIYMGYNVTDGPRNVEMEMVGAMFGGAVLASAGLMAREAWRASREALVGRYEQVRRTERKA